jgi:flagellar basal body rod protein FlgG
MAGGAYVALSGLRSRVEQLDRLASDIANTGTAGYKAERVTSVAVNRPDFGQVLESAVDVAAGPGRLDFRSGSFSTTGRDLDFALEGTGFFVVDTPAGPRYTRNGQFNRGADGRLMTADGFSVLGQNGPITLANGSVTAEADGTVRAGGVVAGRLQVVDFDDYTQLAREDAGRFRAVGNAMPRPKPGTLVRAQSLEQSNVSLPERMVQMTEAARAFEALQRGLALLFNDVDLRAISEFGRR